MPDGDIRYNARGEKDESVHCLFHMTNIQEHIELARIVNQPIEICRAPLLSKANIGTAHGTAFHTRTSAKLSHCSGMKQGEMTAHLRQFREAAL